MVEPINDRSDDAIWRRIIELEARCGSLADAFFARIGFDRSCADDARAWARVPTYDTIASGRYPDREQAAMYRTVLTRCCVNIARKHGRRAVVDGEVIYRVPVRIAPERPEDAAGDGSVIGEDEIAGDLPSPEAIHLEAADILEVVEGLAVIAGHRDVAPATRETARLVIEYIKLRLGGAANSELQQVPVEKLLDNCNNLELDDDDAWAYVEARLRDRRPDLKDAHAATHQRKHRLLETIGRLPLAFSALRKIAGKAWRDDLFAVVAVCETQTCALADDNTTARGFKAVALLTRCVWADGLPVGRFVGADGKPKLSMYRARPEALFAVNNYANLRPVHATPALFQTKTPDGWDTWLKAAELCIAHLEGLPEPPRAVIAAVKALKPAAEPAPAA